MPKSRASKLAASFVPAKIEPKVPANEAWIPGLPDVAVVTPPSDDLDPSAGGAGAEDAEGEDAGPGSAALAEQFEPLPIEWITGEPAVETLVFELSDGLSYMGQAIPEDEGRESSSDDSPALDEASLEGDADDALQDSAEEDRADGAANPEETGEAEGLRLDSEDLSGAEGAPAEGFLSEADHAAALEQARAEAYAEGLKSGIAEGVHQGMEQGIARGRELATAALEAQISERVQALEQMLQSVARAASDPQRLFMPLKRLSIHLAQQLVRGELTISGEAINRLVEQCLLEFDRSAGTDIVLALNPEDLERWRRDAPGVIENLQVRGDPSLGMGSVRLGVGESVVEDLIEHRLHSLASRLLGEAHGRNFSRMMPLRSAPGVIGDISDVG